MSKIKNILMPQEQNGFYPGILSRRALFVYMSIVLVLKILSLLFILIFPNTNFFAAINSALLVEMINQERQEQNLAPLKINDRLNQAALMKANDMIENDYFEHLSPSGVPPWDWFDKAGYNYIWAGENLAAHFFDTKSVFGAWMESSAHRENILNENFNDIGVAVLSGELKGSQTTISVLEFGSTALALSRKDSGQNNLPQKDETVKPASIFQAPMSQEPAEPKAQEEMETESEAGLELLQAPFGLTPGKRVLGLAAFNLPEFLRSFYLYFALFLAAALIIFFARMGFRKKTTIVLTLALIGLSVVFVFV